MLCADKLRSGVLHDYFPNFIAKLRTAPQENRYWKTNLTHPDFSMAMKKLARGYRPSRSNAR
jgi:hypothetical protein